MKIEISMEEWMHMQDALVDAKVENALLHDQLKLTAGERDHYRAQVIAAQLGELMKHQDSAKVLPIAISKIPQALEALDSMEEVRLVMCTILQMLPDNAPAELVKMLTDAVPKQVNAKPLVQIGLAKAEDIIERGGTKNVNNYGQKPEKGEKTV